MRIWEEAVAQMEAVESSSLAYHLHFRSSGIVESMHSPQLSCQKLELGVPGAAVNKTYHPCFGSFEAVGCKRLLLLHHLALNMLALEVVVPKVDSAAGH